MRPPRRSRPGQSQLDAARQNLAAQQAQLDATRAQAEADGTIAVVGPQLDGWQAQLDAGLAQVVAKQAELDAGRHQLAAQQQQIDGGLAQVKANQRKLNAGNALIAANQTKLDAGRAKLVAGQHKLDAGKAKLVAGQKALDAGSATIADKQAEIDAGRQKLADGQAGIDAGWATIRDKQAEIDAAPAQIATQTHKLEAGATLLDLSSGVRLVSEDGSAAVAAVMFDAPQTAVPAETKDGLMAAFTATPVDGVGVDFSTSIATGMPEVVGPGEAVGLVVAAIVLFVMLGTLVGGRSAHRHGAHRCRHRLARRHGAVRRRRDGVHDAGPGHHARPRGRHRLRAVHRQPPSPPAHGRLQRPRIHRPRDGHVRQCGRLRRAPR